MIVFCVVVSLRIQGLEKKSLVKIASLVYNCRMVEVHTMNKLVHVLRNFGIVVSNPNGPFMFFLPCLQGSVSLAIVYEIAITATDFVNNTSALQGRWFVLRSWETRAQNKGRFVTHFNAVLSETPLTYGRTTKGDTDNALALEESLVLESWRREL